MSQKSCSYKGPMMNLALAGSFSILTALCFPFLTLLFGHVFKEFINYNLAVKIQSLNLTSDEYYCALSNNTNIAEYFLPNGHHLLHVRIATLTFINLATSLLFFASAALTRSLSAIAAAQMGRRLRLKYFSAIMRKHVGWFEGDWSSELPTLLLEGIQIIEIGMTCSIVLVQQSCVIIASLAVAFFVNSQLATVTSFLLPFFVFLSYILIKIISLIAVKEQDALLLASSVAEESLQFIETVKIFEGQDQEIYRYLHYIERANKESRKILMLTALMVGFLYLFILSIFTVGSWFGFHLMLHCQCEASDIILVTAEIVICGFSVSELLPAIGEVVAAIQSATLIKRVIGVRERSKADLASSDGMSLGIFEGGIEFSDVVFCYPSCPFPNVLSNVSFKVHPKQTVALIGLSGCGKSTILKLIQRLYNIQEGMIRFDNVDGKYLNVQWLRSHIGIVSFNSTLFNNVSIAENIGYGKEDSTMEEIIQASKMANAHGFITDLPYGYTSLVGADKQLGVLLTQEQDILIGIARALIRDPKILLLDLSGCEVHKEMEEVVLTGLNKAREGRTTIIIPHKLSTIQSADVIVGINEGRVVEMGSHSELLEKNGLYKSLLMNETYNDEFSNITDEVTMCSNGDNIDSNKLIEELENSASHSFSTIETTELSPLIHKSTINTNSRAESTLISLYREVLSIVFDKSHWFLLFLAIVFFILAGATLSSFFILFEQLSEHFNNTDSVTLTHAADLYPPLFSVLGLIMMGLNFIGYVVLSVCEENLNMGIRQKTFSGLLSQQLNWFAKRRNTVDVLSNLLSMDASKISQVLSVRIGSIAWSVTALLGAMSAAFALCWPIGLTLLPPYFWLLTAGFLHCKFTKRFSDYRNMHLKEGKMMATDAIRNISTVVQFGIEDLFIKRYDSLHKEPFRCDMKHAAILGVLYGLSQMITFLFIGFGYLIGTFLILSSSFKFTYSDILTALFTIWFSSQIFKGKFDVMPGLQDGATSSKRILKYFSKQSNSNNEKERKIPNQAQYSLKLENVWCDGNSKEKLFQSSLRTPSPVLSVNPGETLALVGPEFSQNSTVLSLVEKIDNPTPNSVLLDGIDICELNTKWLQRQISIVSRYPVLFNMTVMDNIRYGVNYRHVSKDEVISVTQSAGVHDVLRSLPQGYNTVVGFNGYNLSLEQKLSVAIARAMIRNPKILLMDDTPYLVNAPVSNALNKARKGRTTIVIANKMSTIQNANSIAVLHKGRVLEQGTHSELMEKKGAYFIMNDILEQF